MLDIFNKLMTILIHCMSKHKNKVKHEHNASSFPPFIIHPSKEMNMTTPMNCVKRISGVKKDHTGHSAILKLQEKQNKTPHVIKLNRSATEWLSELFTGCHCRACRDEYLEELN